MNHLYQIVNKEQQKIQFQLNRPQLDYYNRAGKRNVLLKSRQLGFTTLEAIDMLDDALFSKNYNGLLISYDRESSLDIFNNKIDFAWKNFKMAELYGVDTQRANQLTFDFGDGTVSSMSVRSSGRSGTYNRLHISELGKISRKYPEKAREIITGTIPSVPLDGRVDIESTAEGEVGSFYEMFWEGWNRGDTIAPTDYQAFFYNWTWDDAEIAKITEPVTVPQEFMDYRAKHQLSDIQTTYYYYKWLSLNKNWGRLRQEYPTTPEEAFVGSGNKLFDPDKVADQKVNIKTGAREGDWRIYEDFQPSHKYAMGVDVALGVGQDSSTAAILDFTPNEPVLVAEFWSNKIAPDMLAHELKNLGNRYGSCLIAVERNNHGYTTLNTLKDMYFNIYTEMKHDEASDKMTKKLGWYTSASTKPKMLYELNDAINEGIIRITSKYMLEELRTYDKEDLGQISFDDEQTQHWDRLIALAICWQMKTESLQTVNESDIKTNYLDD